MGFQAGDYTASNKDKLLALHLIAKAWLGEGGVCATCLAKQTADEATDVGT